MKKPKLGPVLFPAALELVEKWIEEQLRPEGREGIYIDDESALAYEITQAMKTYGEHVRKETIGECASVVHGTDSLQSILALLEKK